MDQQKTSEFKQFMAQYWPQYLPQYNEGNEVLTYTYTQDAEKPSLILAVCLFLIGIVPGIIYLALGGKKEKEYVLHINTNDFKFTGKAPDKIEKSYESYKGNSSNFKVKKFKKGSSLALIATILWILILVAVYLLFFN